MTAFDTSDFLTGSDSRPTFPPVMVPILPWQNAKLLSEALGDTVYASSAFATAVKLLFKLGVPKSRGAIGVEVPSSRPESLGERGQGPWISRTEPTLGAALRGVVRAREILSAPKDYERLLELLREEGWFGLEIQTSEENLPRDLQIAAQRGKDAGLHVTLNLLPGALHTQNSRVIRAFDTVALHLIPSRQLSAERLKYLESRQVVGLVVDAATSERTNLEAAWESLVLLRAQLDVDARVSVGVAGSFTTGALATQLRADQVIREKIWARGAKQKIFEALDLSLALRHGKESVAAAFAADQIARASRLTSRGIA